MHTLTSRVDKKKKMIIANGYKFCDFIPKKAIKNWNQNYLIVLELVSKRIIYDI